MREAFTGRKNADLGNVSHTGSDSTRIAKMRTAIEAIEQRIALQTGGGISKDELHDMQQQLDRLSKQVDITTQPTVAKPVSRPPVKSVPIAPKIHVKPVVPTAAPLDLSVIAKQQDQALEVISRQFDVLKAEISTLKKSVEKPVAASPKLAENEIQRIAKSLAGMNNSANVTTDVVDKLGAELANLRLRMKKDLQREVASTKEINSRLDSLTEGFETLAVNSGNALMPKVDDLSQQMDTIRTSIEDLPQTLSITTMEKRLNMIAGQIQTLSEASPEKDLSGVEKRLDEIARALVAVSNMGNRSAEDPELLMRLEERFASLDHAVSALANAPSNAVEGEQLLDLASRIENLTDRLGSFEKYAEQGDIGAASALFAGPDTSALEQQLAQLTNKLDETAHVNSTGAQLSNLESQIGQILSQMNKQTDTAIVDFTPMEARLGQLESKLDSNTQFSMEAAQQAAQQAVSMLGAESDPGQTIAALSNELQSLQSLTQSGAHTNHALGEVQQTLGSIVDRLNQIEGNLAAQDVRHDGPLPMPRAPQFDPEPQMQVHAAQTMEAAQTVALANDENGYEFSPVLPEPVEEDISSLMAPALDPTDHLNAGIGMGDSMGEHMPLEPSETAPVSMPNAIGNDDLNNLVEEAAAKLDMAKASYNSAKASYGSGADNIKPDPIGAARRALKATTDEMKAAHGDLGSAAENLTDEKTKASLLSRLGDLNIRKPLIVAAAATLLLVAASMGYTKFMTSNDADVASAPAPVVAQTEETVAVQPSPETTVAPENSATNEVAQPQVEDNSATLGAPVANDMVANQMLASKPLLAETPAVTPSDADSATLEMSKSAVNNESVASVASPQAETVEIPTAPPEPTSTTKYADVSQSVGPVALVTAAREGDPKALFELGMRYSDGKIVARDMVASAQWFERSAEEGFAPAQYSVGSLYEKGIGVTKNVNTAAAWYAKAADQGNARAMHNLAVINAMGGGGAEPDMDTAVTWFKQAAEFGIKDSQFNLGILYGQGMGVPQDLSESYKWFAIAAKTGDADAAAKRDEVAKAMDAAELAEMKTTVKDWKAKKPADATNRVAVPQEWRGKSESAGNSIETLIKKAQVSLNDRGFKVGEPDGMIGPKTKRAIMEFQRAAGIPITGQVDQSLVSALGIKS